jgi:hypothetical protein
MTVLTTRPGQVAGGATTQLLVASQHKVRDRRDQRSWLPYGTQHAWSPGERHTLCGQWINGWTVFWDRSFDARQHPVCPRCIEATLPARSRERLDWLELERP